MEANNGANNQIRQMVNFILQEAHEKANEIRIKTEHDFNLEKQMLEMQAKLKMQEEYTQKERDREVQHRIARSSAIGSSRVQKMAERDTLLQGIVGSATETVGGIAATPGYGALLQKLIVQGLIKIEETTVEVFCRPADLAAVKGCVQAAVKEYVSLMRQEAGLSLKLTVTVNEKPAKMLPTTCSGGVILKACEGRIVCDNTLDARVKLVYHERLPVIRSMLFGESVKGVH